MNKIDICKNCKNKAFDRNIGIVCGLTNAKPTFDTTCPNYDGDERAQKKTFTEKYRPNDQRALTAVILIGIMLALEVVSILSSYLQYKLLTGFQNGEELSVTAATANDNREIAVAVLYVIMYIISGYTFIMWFRRAYFNLHQKTNTLTYNEGWAAGAWFVPFVNLGRPVIIMHEMYTEAIDYLKNKGTDLSETISTTAINFWWALWIVNAIMGQIISKATKYSDSVESIINLTVADMVNSAIGIILALVTIKVIRDYAKIETYLAEDKPIINA